MLHRKNWEYILLGVAALIVLPIMCNAIMLITSEAVWLLQMGEGLNLFVPVCLLLLEGTRTNQPMVKKYVRAARTGAVVLAVLVVYGNVCSAVIDQEAMYEGRKTLKSMSNHIADDLMSSGYFDDNEQLPVLFVGRPSSNSSFMKREYYLYANPYAQMGPLLAERLLGQSVLESGFQGYYSGKTQALLGGTVRGTVQQNRAGTDASLSAGRIYPADRRCGRGKNFR